MWSVSVLRLSGMLRVGHHMCGVTLGKGYRPPVRRLDYRKDDHYSHVSTSWNVYIKRLHYFEELLNGNSTSFPFRGLGNFIGPRRISLSKVCPLPAGTTRTPSFAAQGSPGRTHLGPSLHTPENHTVPRPHRRSTTLLGDR